MTKEIKTMANEALRQSMIIVLRARYKKDAPAAFEAVEAAGFETYKCDGHWGIRNRNTGKSIRMRDNGKVSTNTGYADAEKVDIIAYLETPYSQWRNIWLYGQEYAPTKPKLSELRYAKRCVESCDKEIAQLQKKLDEKIKEREEALKKLMKRRAEYGLLDTKEKQAKAIAEVFAAMYAQKGGEK